jgi:hypothetical protein
MPQLLFISVTILGMIIIYVLVLPKYLKEKSQQPLDVEQSENLNWGANMSFKKNIQSLAFDFI